MYSKNLTLKEAKMLFCKFDCPYKKGLICENCREEIDMCALCQIDEFIRVAKEYGVKLED
jgi:hypothetical protein